METSLKTLVNDFYLPELRHYFDRIYLEREEFTLGGEKSLDGRDKMVAGVIMRVCSLLALEGEKSSGDFKAMRPKLKEVIDFVSRINMITWGRYFYLTSLNRLRKAGVADQLVGPETHEYIKSALDWRDFVREDLTLINLPTNYYSIAFIIAKCREIFGWEKENFSEKFLNKMMDHVEKYSFGSDYIDETDGYGRFDEYSLYILGEICSMFLETDMQIPQRITRMLRRSCDIYLTLANEEGKGFCYGRTLGAYGDSTVLTVFPVSARLGLLNRDEMDIAYAYTVKVAERIRDFWFNKQTRAVDMWDQGRKVDYYRLKDRILEATLDNYAKVLYALECWQAAGYGDRPVCDDFSRRLAAIPKTNYFEFVRGDYCRGLVTRRNKGHVFSLPLVNGGEYYYKCTQYLPVPFECDMFQVAADTEHPNLVPRLMLKDGSRLMPVAWIKDVQVSQKDDDIWEIRYCQDALCLLGANEPREDPRFHCEVKYTLSDGKIEREDIIYNPGGVGIQEIEMTFATFSTKLQVDNNRILFSDGYITEIEVSGIEYAGIQDVNGETDFMTPYGPLRHNITWKARHLCGDTVNIKWSIGYK